MSMLIIGRLNNYIRFTITTVFAIVAGEFKFFSPYSESFYQILRTLLLYPIVNFHYSSFLNAS